MNRSVAAACFGAAVLLSVSATPAQHRAAPRGSNGDVCMPGASATVRTVSVADVVAPDQVTTAPTELAQQYSYGDGSFAVLPAKDWNPLKASAEELAVYGIPDRPTDKNALASWRAVWSHYIFATPPNSCGLVGQSAGTLSYTNWSGKLDHCAAGNCRKVSGVFIQPAFNSCTGAPGAHAIWTGLGDAGSLLDGGLIQAGTDIRPMTGSYVGWWELINYGKSNTAQYEHAFTNWSVAPNDSVQATSWYDTTTQYIHLNLLNLTSGSSVSISFSSVNGEPTTDFWTGRQAEYIDESTTNLDAGGFYNYRRPSNPNGATFWNSSFTNGIAASDRTFVFADIRIYRGHLIGDTGAFGSSGAFADYWRACN
jgi:hypothetical protein